jgi:NAD(P)-dependent dehydrogenase (short-subunit alcohol dehydrogenase family)
LTKELSVRISSYKIRVNSISFGGVEGRVNQSFKKKYAELCPQGRILNYKEIFEPVWFLTNEETSSGATGHNLVIDGG